MAADGRGAPPLFLLLNPAGDPCATCGHVFPYVTSTPDGVDHASPAAHLPVVVDDLADAPTIFPAVPLGAAAALVPPARWEHVHNLSEALRAQRAT